MRSSDILIKNFDQIFQIRRLKNFDQSNLLFFSFLGQQKGKIYNVSPVLLPLTLYIFTGLNEYFRFSFFPKIRLLWD